MPRFITAEDVIHEDFPWCHVELMCTEKQTQAKTLFQCRATFPPNKAHRFHHHPTREEIIYVLQGTAEQWIGEERRRLGPGEMAFIPPGVPHATLNPGTTDLVFLAILSPSDADPSPFTVDVFEEEPWKSLWEEAYPGRVE